MSEDHKILTVTTTAIAHLYINSSKSSNYNQIQTSQLLFTAFQGNLDFCPFTDKTGQCKLLPKHQLVIE